MLLSLLSQPHTHQIAISFTIPPTGTLCHATFFTFLQLKLSWPSKLQETLLLDYILYFTRLDSNIVSRWKMRLKFFPSSSSALPPHHTLYNYIKMPLNQNTLCSLAISNYPAPYIKINVCLLIFVVVHQTRQFCMWNISRSFAPIAVRKDWEWLIGQSNSTVHNWNK